MKDYFTHRQPTSTTTPEVSPLIGSSSGPDLSPELASGGMGGTIGLGLGGFDLPLHGGAEKGHSPGGRGRSLRRPLYASLSRPRAQLSTSNYKPSLLSYLTRVPRRMRPVLLAATAVVILIVVYSSRPGYTSIDSHLAANPGLSSFGNGFIKSPESKLKLVDINEQEPAPRQYPKPKGKPLEWQSPEDELLALIGFITGATGNILPPSVDPESPIDPSVLLGFDPTGPEAAEDLENLKEEVNAQHPLVLFGRLRDHKHDAVSHLLSQWTITPSPLIVEVDMRSDESRFTPVLERLLATDEFPQLVMLGRSIGGAQDILEMDKEELKELLEASEMITVKPPRRAPKHAVNAEKARKERILKPQIQF